MIKFRIYYRQETGDDCIDCEKDVYAGSFDQAYHEFKLLKPLVKIRAIKEII